LAGEGFCEVLAPHRFRDHQELATNAPDLLPLQAVFVRLAQVRALITR
jgi:hypothetical protein